MSTIKYAYLKDQTWLYRRNYPKDVAPLIGSRALKQSLKTGDVRTARTRAAEVNARYEATVAKARTGAVEVLKRAAESDAGAIRWDGDARDAVARLRAALEAERGGPSDLFARPVKAKPVPTVAELSRTYLNRRSDELRHGGFKSVRYSVGLFTSKFSDRPITSITRDDGRTFLDLIERLSPLIGKVQETRRMEVEQLVAWSERRGRIKVRTQKRIWSQVNHFLDWAVYDGHLEQNPFRTVKFDRKVKAAPYAVPTDAKVRKLLAIRDEMLHRPLLFCLLTGMRAGEAAGLLRSDLVWKGNLGTFIHVRPNALRELKTDAAERLVPMHSALETLLPALPKDGPLFPELNVNRITKRFADLRKALKIERPGLVFHSTRKWFITRCERTGVPEHFTASLVGHKSARSENGITYGIYSAGISDEQKRSIVDQIRLPEGVSP
ncbi:MAG: integrase [Maritimibacter sp.]|nr:integrase [Maritimibacter sp.]